MENVRSVFVDVDAADGFAIDIPAEVRAFVDDEAGFALPVGKVGESRAVEARADDEVVVHGGIGDYSNSCLI